ncbi:MAG: CDP-glucose 4,6-dehydratase [Verrucomicrobia bacterium]|nr:MAG: CDP-glucose 4,6-dehydratase [Verrucomicrobiota bacterium]
MQEAYADPPAAFHTNVQGSVNVFECARRAETVRVLIHVSSDKCYLPDPSGGPYAEDHPLGGDDPYSASKAAAELAFLSYLRTLFPAEGRVKAASVRAGNVIGGGDWASDRILPDAARALSRGAPVPVRNPRHTRPWQHVLDALSGYLLLAERLLAGEAALCGAWNFGPDTDDEHPVAELVEKFAAAWGGGNWVPADRRGSGPETARLRLDSSRARRILGWRPRWDFDAAVRRTARWYRDFYSGESARELCLRDLDAHETVGGTEP